MKKIRIVNWAKWKFVQKFRTITPIQAYPNHFDNIFLYSTELEQYLEENGIAYEIDLQEYTFPLTKKTKK